MGILIIHTAAQLDEASSLVDLLEASLALPPGAIRCSSLPGYTWGTRTDPGDGKGAQFGAMLDDVAAAIAFVDNQALSERQLWFDLAAAWARGKRVALIADGEDHRVELPVQLDRAQLIHRSDRHALASLVEDLAFDLGVNPRLGKDAQRALTTLSSAPPPPPPPAEAPARIEPELKSEPRFEATPSARSDRYEAVDTVPPPGPSAHATLEDEVIDDDLDLSEAFPEPPPEPLRELEPLARAPEPRAAAKPAAATNGHSCGLSLEAGRAISECSFHRSEGEDVTSELEASFGRFIDLVGGSWSELKRLGDVEVWLGATDNLLEALPSSKRHMAEWYEMGFQFSTLRAIAEQGLPEDPEERSVYEEMWKQSMTAFRESAKNARVAAHEARRLQGMLENLIGPEAQRDYTNVARSLEELRTLAATADR